ncbi:hypothetical protein VL03_21400 [Rossellomorea marisflavi]|nr:hypothetical protein VL03_21400 [Rossellomorea marisflavi]
MFCEEVNKVTEKNLIPTGNLYTSNPDGLKNLTVTADIWQITRGGVALPNAHVVRELSPSKVLFQKFVHNWKGKPYQDWWHKYEKNFLKEMENEVFKKSLRSVYKELCRGKNIVLVCFCKDHRYCHRRLVGEFFQEYGVKVKELNPVLQDQLTLF